MVGLVKVEVVAERTWRAMEWQGMTSHHSDLCAGKPRKQLRLSPTLRSGMRRREKAWEFMNDTNNQTTHPPNLRNGTPSQASPPLPTLCELPRPHNSSPHIPLKHLLVWQM